MIKNAQTPKTEKAIPAMVSEELQASNRASVRWEGNIMVFMWCDKDINFYKEEIYPHLLKGRIVTFKDGTTKRIIETVVVDITKTASAMYIWDKTGNKIAHDRWMVTRNAEGKEITRESLRRIFKRW